MPKLFPELRERLLHAGVAPRHVRRYLNELADHLIDLTMEGERAGRNRADAESAALLRLGSTDDLAKAMTEQREFQSWCVRAPWATFGLAPLFLLAGAWSVALFILWSGWNVFLPEAGNPFVRVNGLAMFYFGVGRLIYFTAPVIVSWGIGLIAARQRLSILWPAVGVILIALIGCMLKVGVMRPNAPNRAGHVYMGFRYASSVQMIPDGLSQALALFCLTALPYLLWRLQKARSLSAYRLFV